MYIYGNEKRNETRREMKRKEKNLKEEEIIETNTKIMLDDKELITIVKANSFLYKSEKLYSNIGYVYIVPLGRHLSSIFDPNTIGHNDVNSCAFVWIE